MTECRNTAPKPDVVIIGAGIVGIAAAVRLQQDGRNVLLIDRGDMAMGASHGNAGAFAFSDVLPLASPGVLRKAPRWLMDPLGPLAIPPSYLPRILPWLARFWRASWPDRLRQSTVAQGALMRLASQEMADLVASAGLGDMVGAAGNLELYESRAELTASLPGWQAKADEGIAFHHVEGADLAALQPGLSRQFVAGTFVPGWKNVTDPYLFALALGQHALRLGARFQQGEAVEVKPDGAGVRITLAGQGILHTAHVVIACGAWSKPLAKALGDTVPLETERGYNTSLPPGAFDVRRQLTFGGHGFVISPLSTGIRVGGAVELGGLDAPPNFARSQHMLHKAAAFLPGLNISGGRQWMGFRPSMPDSLPVISPSSASNRIVYAFGHGHLGLTQSAATARIITDLVAGRLPSLDIAPFRATRF